MPWPPKASTWPSCVVPCGRTHRTIWPIAMPYYVDVTLVGAWCELRADYRKFRVERIGSSRVLDEHFDQENGRLFREWSALPKTRPAG